MVLVLNEPVFLTLIDVIASGFTFDLQTKSRAGLQFNTLIFYINLSKVCLR